ncbi:MAG: hypothetical protein OXI05_04590 [Bacteroidota bacterium]|nr:hypothetical protein [Bacteroidota bacterium]MXW14182.1 hypothetical protein [Rhodothermaceae bacterium]MDE2645100.1 hypothetical protein [Bacteroidota bacterium]MXW32584.1 hypothetical protein [Rhodothermaceae bacterium]MXZ17464.1 hypothetical protein [Rhodothermaceae bacterium]
MAIAVLAFILHRLLMYLALPGSHTIPPLTAPVFSALATGLVLSLVVSLTTYGIQWVVALDRAATASRGK